MMGLTSENTCIGLFCPTANIIIATSKACIVQYLLTPNTSLFNISVVYVSEDPLFNLFQRDLNASPLLSTSDHK